MSKKVKQAPDTVSHLSRKKTAGRMALRFLGAFVIFEVIFCMVLLLVLILVEASGLNQIPAYESIRPVLVILLYVVLFAGSLAGCGYLAYRFMLRPLEYLDDVADAAKALAHPDETPIILPDALENIQEDLNQVRVQSIASAKEAREAKTRKDDLLVYLAHDLKTPLTSILGYLKLIQDEPDISRELVNKYAGIALDKTHRLEELINEFFEITRFSTSKLTLEPVQVNLSRMLMQIAYEFKPILTEKHLEWDLDIPEQVHMMCDPDKLERAVDNLIRNAVNYSYEGKKIRFFLVPENGRICIYVENHGPTIPKEKLERIFEQFYRLDSARSADTGGAGLGLAIAKEIIELHHGTITAQSADETIRFTIELPAHG